jgi:hypothetical protein
MRDSDYLFISKLRQLEKEIFRKFGNLKISLVLLPLLFSFRVELPACLQSLVFIDICLWAWP